MFVCVSHAIFVLASPLLHQLGGYMIFRVLQENKEAIGGKQPSCHAPAIFKCQNLLSYKSSTKQHVFSEQGRVEMLHFVTISAA